MLSVAIQRASQLGISQSLPVLHVRALATLVLYMVFAAFSLLQFTDPDFWWHLRTGELILETGSIPRSDPFSFTAAGSDWIAHEWGSEVLIYAIEDGLGYWANVLLFTAVALAALAVMHRLVLKMGVSPRVALGLALLAGTMSLPYWTVRPLAFSWLFTALFLYTLYHRRIEPKTPLWHLPPLMLLWANLHAGYVIGLVLLGLWLLATAAERVLSREQHDLRGPALLVIASLAVTVVNPNGPALLTYPLIYVVPGNAIQRFIGDFQSPDFHSPLHWPLLLGIIALLVVGVRGQGRNLFGVALAATFTFIALQSSRNQPLFALVFMAVMGDALSQRRRLTQPGDAARPAPRGPLVLNWSILAAAALVLALAVGRSSLLQLRASPLTTGLFDYPVEGAQFIRDKHPDARMFNLFGWGGYLINELYPEQQVFIDGRIDMYGDTLMEEYIRVERLQPGWREVLERYDIDLVIHENDSALTAALLEAADWRLAFSGPVEAVFVREPGGEASPTTHSGSTPGQ